MQILGEKLVFKPLLGLSEKNPEAEIVDVNRDGSCGNYFLIYGSFANRMEEKAK